jgi:hypothetical protein
VQFKCYKLFIVFFDTMMKSDFQTAASMLMVCNASGKERVCELLIGFDLTCAKSVIIQVHGFLVFNSRSLIG